MTTQRFASVWDAIEDTPEEAENMKLRSVLMQALKNHIERSTLSQAQAAKLLGVTQPRVSDLMRGKINLFALDALVNMASAAGLHIELRVRERAWIRCCRAAVLANSRLAIRAPAPWILTHATQTSLTGAAWASKSGYGFRKRSENLL